MVVLQFIKKFNQEILIDWFVEEQYKGLLEVHPHINKVHLVNLQKAKKKKSIQLLIKELKKLRKHDSYDFVIDMQGLLKSAIVSRMIHSKITLGFDKHSSRERFSAIFYNKKFSYKYEENIIDRNFELIKFALALPFDKEEILKKRSYLYPKKKYVNPSISNIKKNILLVIGASTYSKMYPYEKFAEIIELLDENYFIIWGNSSEKIIANKIQKISNSVNVCEKLSLSELISLISQVDLIIGPDTGPTHIAWALNIPSVTLFGPTPGYRNTMVTNNNIILESDSKVNPLKINKSDKSIQNIPVKKIVSVSRYLLNNSSKN
jgi:heptosyltransferase-1